MKNSAVRSLTPEFFLMLVLFVCATPLVFAQAGCCCDPVTKNGSLMPQTRCPQNYLFLIPTSIATLDCGMLCKAPPVMPPPAPAQCVDPQSRAPQDVVITPVQGELALKLSFTLPCPSDLLKIERCAGIGCTDFKLIEMTEPATTYVDATNLLFNTNYTYRISAKLNLLGDSAPIVKTAQTGDLECLYHPTSDQFCLSLLAYEQYKPYLTTQGYYGKQAQDFVSSFEQTTTALFNARFNKAFSCTDKNTLVGPVLSCSEGQFCVSNAVASCISPSSCVSSQNTFGLLSTVQTCEGTSGSATFCFYDRSKTATNTCYPCNPRLACYDYKTQGACTRNPCGIGQCEWRDIIPALGIGVCIDTRFNNCVFCHQEGTSAAPNKEAYNTVFDACTPQRAEALSTLLSPCFFKAGTLTEPPKSVGCENTTCRDYTRGQCKSPVQGIQLNADNSFKTFSADPCNIHACEYTPQTGCVKNADGTPNTQLFWEDCAPTDKACEQDYFPPKTTVLPIGLGTKTHYLRVKVTDQYDKTHPPRDVLGQPNYTTSICVYQTNKTPCTPNTIVSSDQLTLNDVTLKLQEGTKEIAPLFVGSNTIRYFSVDDHKNKEVMKEKQFVACANCTGPLVLSLQVRNSRELGDRTFTSDKRPHITVVFNKKSSITVATFTKGNKNIPLTQNPQGQSTTFTFQPVSDVDEGEYVFSLNAQDQNNFFMDQAIAKRIITDYTAANLTIQPSDGTVINGTSTPILLLFSEAATLDTVTLDEHVFFNPYVEVLIPRNITSLFVTDNNRSYRLKITGLSAGPKTIVVRAKDYTGRPAEGRATFFVNTKPTQIRLAKPLFGVAATSPFDIVVETTTGSGTPQTISTPLNTPSVTLPALPALTSIETASRASTTLDAVAVQPSTIPAATQSLFIAPPSQPITSQVINMDIVDFDFVNKTLTVKQGDTIVWTNKGQAPHTVSAKDKSFDSGNILAGKTFTKTFTTPGTYQYACSFHPNMVGTVVVTALTAPPVTGAVVAGASTSTVDCRYAFGTPVPPPKDSYQFLPAFDVVEGNRHSIKKFKGISLGDNKTYPFHVLCKDSFGMSQQSFQLRIDNTAPIIIAAFADPAVVGEEYIPKTKTYQTTLKVQLDEEGFCKYSTSTDRFDVMEETFPYYEQLPKKTHVKDILVTSEGNHSVFVACKNLAELTTSTKKISFRVDTSIPFTAVSTTPATATSRNVTLSVVTSKRSFCYTGTSPQALLSCMGACNFTFAHTQSITVNQTGNLTFFAQCNTASGGESSPILAIPLLIDTSPPFMLYAKDDGPLVNFSEIQYTTDRLRVAFLGNDTETPVTQYLLRVDDVRAQPVIDWMPSTQRDGAFFYLTKNHEGQPFRLQDKEKYVLRVVPVNLVGLKGAEATSDGVLIDTTKTPPACQNDQFDSGEKDVDCGGPCLPCGVNKKCTAAQDCTSKVCAGTCAAPTCTDAVHNSDEGDVDCGGSCTPCAQGSSCNKDTDCETRACYSGTCQKPNLCLDKALSPEETDVDCGGICPVLCKEGQSCTQRTDCDAALFCYKNTCTSVAGDDADQDGVPDVVDRCPATIQGERVNENGCSTCQMFSQGDTLSDCWREKHFQCIDCPQAGANADPDNDGLSNTEEYQQTTNPTIFDTDGDGWSDGVEVEKGTNPLDPASKPTRFLVLFFWIILILFLIAGGTGVVYWYYQKIKPSVLPAFKKPERAPQKTSVPSVPKPDLFEPLRTFAKKPELPEQGWLGMDELAELAKKVTKEEVAPEAFKKLKALKELTKKEKTALAQELAQEPSIRQRLKEIRTKPEAPKNAVEKLRQARTEQPAIQKLRKTAIEHLSVEERKKFIRTFKLLKEGKLSQREREELFKKLRITAKYYEAHKDEIEESFLEFAKAHTKNEEEKK